MDEDVFNMSIRKFLKKVGVTSQREIEHAVHEALASGAISGDAALKAKVALEALARADDCGRIGHALSGYSRRGSITLRNEN